MRHHRFRDAGWCGGVAGLHAKLPWAHTRARPGLPTPLRRAPSATQRNAGLAGCTVYAYNAAGMLATSGAWGAAIAEQLPPSLDPTIGTRETWAYIAYGLTAFTGLIFLFTLIMLRRVAVAVACIKVRMHAGGEGKHTTGSATHGGRGRWDMGASRHARGGHLWRARMCATAAAVTTPSEPASTCVGSSSARRPWNSVQRANTLCFRTMHAGGQPGCGLHALHHVLPAAALCV